MRYLRVSLSFRVCSCLRACPVVQSARRIVELIVMLITAQKGISMDGVEACAPKDWGCVRIRRQGTWHGGPCVTSEEKRRMEKRADLR